MDIKSLPRDVRTQLRSGANINSISQCATELVLNSLDAKSTAIAIRINLLTFRIQVVDNGKGVTKSNMNFIGIRYMTSKCQSLADLKKIKRFGFRGEALASICSMSKKITITSRPDNIENTYSKVYENGKWNAVELVKQRPSQGTTVTVEGFMHNLPVRQKRIDQNLDMHEIKRKLADLAIIHPNVSLNLRNDSTGIVVFQSSKTQTVSQALTNLYPDISIEDLMEIKISKNKISVSGLISKNHSTNSKLQLIYLNKRPIVCPKIQNLINSLLLKSLISRKRSSTLRPENFLNFESPIEKTEHPIYVINIKCPYSEVDLTLSPSKKTVEFKQWNVVLKCVEKAVVKLLEHENLISTDSTKQEIKLPSAPSFKSQFGVSQILGAVKSIPAKRKIVGNVTELPKKCSKISRNLDDSKTKIDSGGNISGTEELGKENVEVGSSPKNSFSSIRGHAKVLTSAEVHNEANKDNGQRTKLKVLSTNKEKSCKKKNFLPIIDDANDINVLSADAKPGKFKNRRSTNLTKTITNRETCFKILPISTKHHKVKNLKTRPTLLGKDLNQSGERIRCSVPDLGKTKNEKRRNIKTYPIQNIESDNLVLNSQNIITNIETKNDPKIFNTTETSQDLTNHNQKLNPTNTVKNIPTTIFDKHRNTQSLVLNSEFNATRPSGHPLLNSTINTDIFENQEKGKELIMEMFLKSTVVFPYEEPEIKDNAMKTMVVETTKENLITECRKQNTTMMTVSWKLMSKKTIVTNSVHPVFNLEESAPLSDNILPFPHNGEQKLQANLQNSCKEIKCAPNTRPRENQGKPPKDKMISKCVQTTMIEHEKEFKIDFNCVTESEPKTNSKFTFCNSIPQNSKFNLTFSKYFGKSHRREQNKPETYYFPGSYFKNDFKFNNFHNYDEPKSFGIGKANLDFVKENNCPGHSRPSFNFNNYQPLNKIQIPHFGTNECLHRPFHNYAVPGGYFHNFPTDNGSYGNCPIANNYNAFNRYNNEIFPNYDTQGKNFRKPIKKYFSDYNFDFSNLDAFDEPFKQFMEQEYNFESHHHYFPYVKRTNPSHNFINQQRNNCNVKNGCADVTCDITVPLYQSYNPNKLNILGQHSHYQPCFVQEQSMDNYITTNNWHADLQYPTRNKIEEYLHPKTITENCNQNRGQHEENAALEEELYKSIIRDYGQQRCFQAVRDQKMDVLVNKNIIPEVPKRESHNFWPGFPTNICLQPLKNKPSISKQAYYHHNPFHQQKCNIAEKDSNQKCYSPFFQKPTRRDEHHTKIPTHNRQESEYQNQSYHHHRTKNMENQRNPGTNQPMFPMKNLDNVRCASPFFRKVSNYVPITESRKKHFTHKRQKYVPIEEVSTNHENMESIDSLKFGQIDDHQESPFVTPPTKRVVATGQQHGNHNRGLLEEPQKQPFFLPKQSNRLLKRQNDFFCLEQKENQTEQSGRKQNLQEYSHLFAGQPNDQLFKNAFQKQDGGNKLQHNSTFFFNPGEDSEQPQTDLLFPTKNPQNTWQLIPPNTNKISHQRSKLSLKKFGTEPPQATFNFQQKSEPAIKKFCTEPFRPIFYKNNEEYPKRYKLDVHPQSKPLFLDLTAPKCNAGIEYTFATPNINKSSTIDATIEKISLDDSENFELSSLKEMEEESNLTVCSKNFKPALSSTRFDVVEEDRKSKCVHPLNALAKTEQPEIAQEECDLSSSVIEGTPTSNFFVPSLNHIIGKSQHHHEDDNSKKSGSVLNISINAIKKSQLIEKGMADDCKLSRKSVSGGSEQSNINLVNSGDCNMTSHVLNNVKHISVVEHQKENDLEDAQADDEWIQKVNPFGSVFYIHKRTGMTSMFKPKQDSHFNLIKRIEFVPKGLSPIFIETKQIDASLSPTSKKSLHAAILENYENELNTVKWSNYIYDYNDAKAFFEELYREKTKQFECQIPNTSLNEFPKSMVKLCNKMQAQSFTKDIFSELEIIGQLDNKFIITVLKNKMLVILFDQHAVHERMRLEQLLKEYKEAENENSIIKFKSTKCQEKIIIMLTSSEVNILTNFKNLFENLGLQYIIFANGIEVTHIPTCIHNKFVGSKAKSKETYLENVNSLIYEQIAMVMSTRGVSSKMPNLLQNIINSEACRGAVKFGDKLTIDECEKHIKELSLCQLPFQCAHGRPTLVPVVSVKQNCELNKIKPKLKKLKIM